MPRLPLARPGERLTVKGRALDFSFWPVTRGRRRYGLQDSLFAMSPWPVLQGVVSTRTSGPSQREARAFLQQALDFYTASTIGRVSSNPLLLYYAFLNLAKTFAITSGHTPTMVEAKHGIIEDRRAGGDELAQGLLGVIDDPGRLNVFPLLIRAMGYTRRPTEPDTRFRIFFRR